MKRDTKIICTLGPASAKTEMIEKMAERGMNVARINFSHGSHKQHQKMIDNVREVNKRCGHDVSILQDLEGYRMRVGVMPRSLNLQKDDIYYFSNAAKDSDHHIPFDYQEELKEIKVGANIFIDDGKIHLKVIDHVRKTLKAKVVQGGILKQRKGINIPGLVLKADILTDKDRADLVFGIKNNVEKVAQSFVRNKKDIQRVIDIVKPQLPNCKVIAKIETEDGVKNLDSIIEACDGILIARGDLGVTMPIYKIPIIQKHIIRRCNRKKKLVITATQMLDSMIENGRPTRAEVSDVANAILDGTDYVMLSGETAVGKYPSRSVKMMSQIVSYTEAYDEYTP